MTFERNIERLEEIAERLADEGLELDAALGLFEEAVAELRSAAAELSKADARLKTLTETADGLFEVRDLRA